MRDGDGHLHHRLQHGELRPDGRPHGRLHRGRASQTLSDKEYQMLRTASLKIIRALGIEGGCNVQLALDPKQFRLLHHRSQSARVALLRAGVQGDRLPHRPRRRQNRHRDDLGRDRRTPSPRRRWPALNRRWTTAS